MKLTQNWVGYLDRSYTQIKQALLNRLVNKVPELSDHSESNIMVILVSMFAGVAESLHLYIDRIGRESFIGTATKYSSVSRLAKLIGYNGRASMPSTVDLTFTLVDSNTNVSTTYNGGAILIPKGTLISNQLSKLQFKTIEDVYLPINKNKVIVSAIQSFTTTNYLIGVSNGQQSQRFQLPTTYEDGSLEITINNEKWESFETPYMLFDNSKGFWVTLEDDGFIYVNFGDGIDGIIPQNNINIFGKFNETLGTQGNSSPNTITVLESTIALPTNLAFKITNEGFSVGGTNIENIEQIRNRAPRNLRTLRRAVTKQDYTDIAVMVPGVGDALTKFCCGKYVSIYIVPDSLGIATLILLYRVKLAFQKTKMITTQVDIIASGKSKIWIKGKIYAGLGITTTNCNLQVMAALEKSYGIPSLKINKRIVVSDIIALLESLNTVERAEIEEIKIVPYPLKLEGTKNELDITFNSLPISTIRRLYTLNYTGVQFELYINNSFVTLLNVNTAYTDGSFCTFTIGNTPTYLSGDRWDFTISPTFPQIFPSTEILISDFTAPVMEVGEFINNDTPRTIYGNLIFLESNINLEPQHNCG